MIPALSLHDVRKEFGATPIIRGVSLEVAPGERHAIIGPNGAGKTTLFHLVSGGLTLTSGEIRLKGERHQRPAPQPDQPSRPVPQLPGHQHLP